MPEDTADRPDTSADGATTKKRSPLLYVAAVIVALGPLGGYFGINYAKLMKARSVKDEKAETKEPPKLSVYVVPPLLVNLRNTRGTRYLKASISLELSEVNLSKELDAQKPRLVDYLLSKLSSCELITIDGPAEKARLKREIVADLNDMLSMGRVVNIYFTEFVVQ